MTLKRLLFLFLLLCATVAPVYAQDEADAPLVRDLDPRYATEWIDLVYLRVQAQAESPTTSSRVYGYAGVTLYESLVNGMPGYVSLTEQIGHMPVFPRPEAAAYDWISVMDSTMTTVLPTVFTAVTPETVAAFEELRDAHTKERLKESDAETIERSLAYGVVLGEAIANWAADDGFADVNARGKDYVLPEIEGGYVLTDDAKKPNQPYWGEMRPFVLERGSTCHVPIDVPYSTDPDSVFYAQALEVMQTGRRLTNFQRETSRYWIDTPGVTGAPGGHWISITNQLTEQLGLTLDEAAWMHAMVGMSVADAFISGWWSKYQTMVIRPVTYIQENISRGWGPYVETPPFPEYVSGHSIVSAAAAETLTRLFGPQFFEDRTHVIYKHEEPLVRSYTSFEAAASEAAISRLYGGIHYRSAIENGLRQGRCVGSAVSDVFNLQPAVLDK
ncbi:MAG: vanadium-dependent haloperoxidase [Chloroflexi bacterium]|nr:vanadium-dependent haloperoxidase [Chloroflexota bacterium]MCC6896276.1 vanadium-dependent haloperoxidase [Anaerolineae bacterium]